VVDKETAKERWDRNFADLLQELRVAQTGVQILFAFLLTLPFSSQFPKTTPWQRDVYVLALLSAAVSAALIISPVAFHRALFRQRRKPELVRYAHRMASGGLAAMLVSMVSSVDLIADVVLEGPPAVVVSVAIGAVFLLLWVVLPFIRRNRWADGGNGHTSDLYADESIAAVPTDR
jgi:hypothetical protein